jgi:hypothetical protein
MNWMIRSMALMTTYELGDSDPDPLQALVFVRLHDPSPVRFERFLGGAPTSGPGLTFRAPDPATPRTRSLRRSAR